MPQPAVRPDEVEAILALLEQGVAIKEIVRITGRSAGTVSNIKNKFSDGSVNNAPSAGPEEKREFRENEDGTAVVICKTDRIVKSEQDALEVAEVDLSVWRVKSWEVKTWTVPVRVRMGQDENGRNLPDKPIQTQQYGVKLYLQRIMAKSLHESLQLVFDRLERNAPRLPKPEKNKATKGEPFLAVFGLFDVHFGKLCWQEETGSNYDLKITESIFRHAVEDLMRESSHREIGQIVLPIGNDWLHIDNRKGETTRGTPQDVDGRFSKVFAAAEMAALWAVDRLRDVAPVRVVWVPGNHDMTLSEMLCRIVRAYYSKDKGRVEVDVTPGDKKYFRWGVNLLGFTHGDQIRAEDLPAKMAVEAPEDWSTTKCREWLIGHMHRSRKWVTKGTDTFDGTVVRVLQSLSGTDAWHYSKGYIGTRQAAEVYWYGRDRGYAGHSVVQAR
jgi:transposase